MSSVLTTIRNHVTNSPLANRFFSGAAWSITGAVVSNSISLLLMIIIARLLGKESYGQFIIVQSTLGTFGVLAGFGIGTTATRYVAELRLRDSERLSHILALSESSVIVFGAIASGTLAATSGLMASVVLKTPELALPLSIAAFSVFFSALDGYQKSVLIGLEAMRSFAIGTIVGTAASIPVMIVAAKMYGLNGIAAAMVACTLIQSCISRFQMTIQLKHFSIKRITNGCCREWRVLRDFAFPALLAGVLVSPAHWVCHAMLANTPTGFAELALLGVGMQWFNVILFLPNVAGRVVLPILTEHFTDKNHADAKRLLLFAIGANALVTVPAAVLIAIFSNQVLKFYGTDFQNGSFVIVIAVITAVLLSIQGPVGNVIIAVSRIWLGALMNFGWALTYIGLTYLLINHGSVGVMAAMGIAYLIHSIWTFAFAINLINSNEKIQPLISKQLGLGPLELADRL